MTFKNIPTEVGLSLTHLQAELTRIDVLIHREVRRWQLAGQNPADSFRGLHLSDAQADHLLSRPFAAGWGQTVALASNEAAAFAQAEINASHKIEAVVAQAQAQGLTTRWQQLAAAFELDRFELDALLICLAPTLDLRYEQLYGYLQDDVTRRRPRVNLVLDLLCEPGVSRLLKLAHFADDAPLIKHALLTCESAPGPDTPPLLSQTLRVDNTIVGWLLGNYHPHLDLGPNAQLLPPPTAQTTDLPADDFPLEFNRIANTEMSPLFVFYGVDGSRQESAAGLLAAHLGRPLLRVNLGEAAEAGVTPRQVLRLALRDARLTGAIPHLAGWDIFLERQHRLTLLPAMLAQVYAFPHPVVISSLAVWQAQGVDRTRPIFWLEFPIPTHRQRLALWQHFLREKVSSGPNIKTTNGKMDGPANAQEPEELSALAGQFLLTGGQIRDAVATAKDMAAYRTEAVQIHHLFAAARSHSNPNLSALAKKINLRYSWSDIILPPDSLTLLREIVTCVQRRSVVLEEWGVGRKLAASRGVTILFVGEPGTGKTMAAEVIADELGLDLYKIDLSGIISKYIGETEKNLEQIFNEAQSSNAILFFDEADAIFGKRSEVKDAHDRYANIEVSYLLQRMEAYDGVTILATNLRANLDDAFTRRLQFVVDFPFPEEVYRLRIWQTLFPPGVPRTANLDLPLLARRFKLPGGNIRNVIVSAAYLAAADGGQVTMGHMLHGLRRELQKMGRLVNEADLQIDVETVR